MWTDILPSVAVGKVESNQKQVAALLKSGAHPIHHSLHQCSMQTPLLCNDLVQLTCRGHVCLQSESWLSVSGEPECSTVACCCLVHQDNLEGSTAVGMQYCCWQAGTPLVKWAWRLCRSEGSGYCHCIICSDAGLGQGQKLCAGKATLVGACRGGAWVLQGPQGLPQLLLLLQVAPAHQVGPPQRCQILLLCLGQLAGRLQGVCMC